MSFFNSLGKFFGFGNDDADYNEIAGSDNQPTIIRPVFTIDTPESQSAEKDEPDEEPEFVKSEDIPVEQIFEKVVDIFNQALPDFIAQNIDKEKQQRQIYEALDSSLKQYIKNLAQNADKDANQRWQNERKRLMAEIDQHRENSKRQSETEEGLRNQHLSAERQKRALSERINDLEGQIATLEAEREQFELEKKSLVNKLRASTVQEGEIDPSVISESTQLLYDRISDLETKVSDLEGEREQLIIENKSLNNKLRVAAIQGGNIDPTIIPDSTEIVDSAEQQQKIDELNNEIETLTTKLEFSETMARESQSIASTTKKELQERETEIENLNREISALKSSAHISDDKETVNISTINELEEKNEELSRQIESLSEELSTANESLQTLEIIESQIEKFEEVKKKKDSKIQELIENRDSLLSRIEQLEAERLGLKRTVETNIAAQSESEIKLRDEINQLRMENEQLKQARVSVTDNEMPIYSAPEPIANAVKLEPVEAEENTTIISAIDESLDNTDWLVATPPEGTSMRLLTKSDDQSDFGYQAPPPRKQMPDNDAQMSLWDDEF